MLLLKNYKSILVAVAASFALVACSGDDELKGGSYLDTSTPQLSDLDKWIRTEYVFPYNIEVLYRWHQNEVDLNRYLYPPDETKVKPAMKVVKKVWVNSYNEAGGEDFIKKIAPRQLLLVGGVNLNQSATITLGLAEGGKKITFFETDFLKPTERASITRFLQTIQHEYLHILNQTKPYDKEAYAKITPSNYTGTWFNSTDEQAREMGNISAYSRANVDEDIAEMVSFMLVRSPAEWNALVDGISNDKAREDIRKKEALIVEYYKTAFDIDLYELQRIADRNSQEVVNGNF